MKQKNKLIDRDQLKINDLIFNPIIIKGNLLNDELTEYAIKQAILNNLSIKWNTMCSKLGWSHYRELLVVKK